MRWTEEQLEEYLKNREQPKPSTKSRKRAMPTDPTEDEEQMALFTWAHHMAATGHIPELSRLFHVPNGGRRGPAEAGRFKAMGVKPGVPDVFLDVPRGGFHGLRIELKRRNGGKVSKDQTDWIDWYNANGYRAVICYGWDEAREEIENYFMEGMEHDRTNHPDHEPRTGSGCNGRDGAAGAA